MIAAYIAVPEGWNAFSFQTDLGIGLSSRFYGIENISVNGADLHITAECCLCNVIGAVEKMFISCLWKIG